MKKIAAILCFIMIISSSFMVFAEDDILIIEIDPGAGKLTINGTVRNTEKPYENDDDVFVPLRTVLEAYGAEVNYRGNGRINLVYRDSDVDIALGKPDYTNNSAERLFKAVPVSVNGITMVPLQFIIENFGGTLSIDKAKHIYTVTLEDDGAITDFSSVIGSINYPKVGNSYFGWSMDIPKGSQLINTSFNSRDISIENKQRGIYIEISVGSNKGKKLEDYYNELKDFGENSDDSYYSSEDIYDYYIKDKADPGYIEILGSSYYNGAFVRRIFVNKGYSYRLTMYSYNETKAERLKVNKYFTNLIDSFSIGYEGNVRNIKDLSTIKDGLVKYKDKDFGFSVDVFPEWEDLKNQYSYYSPNNISIRIGSENKEYINVQLAVADTETDLSKYAEALKNFNNNNFNSSYYEFIEESTAAVAGYEGKKLSYFLNINGQKYIVFDNLILKGGLLYKITLRAAEENYANNRSKFDKMLETMNISLKDQALVNESVDAFEQSINASRIDKADDPANFSNKETGWSLKIPGYWSYFPSFDENYKMFYNGWNYTYLGVESAETDNGLQDESRFDIFSSMLEDGDKAELVNHETIYLKGRAVRSYAYKYKDEESETYINVKFYAVDGKERSYCFFYMIDDLYASESNLKEINSIWESFSIDE